MLDWANILQRLFPKATKANVDTLQCGNSAEQSYSAFQYSACSIPWGKVFCLQYSWSKCILLIGIPWAEVFCWVKVFLLYSACSIPWAEVFCSQGRKCQLYVICTSVYLSNRQIFEQIPNALQRNLGICAKRRICSLSGTVSDAVN